MSNFYCTINSDSRKTEATSRGHKFIQTHIRGWDVGVNIILVKAGERNKGTIEMTGGSNNPKAIKVIKEFEF